MPRLFATHLRPTFHDAGICNHLRATRIPPLPFYLKLPDANYLLPRAAAPLRQPAGIFTVCTFISWRWLDPAGNSAYQPRRDLPSVLRLCRQRKDHGWLPVAPTCVGAWATAFGVAQTTLPDTAARALRRLHSPYQPAGKTCAHVAYGALGATVSRQAGPFEDADERGPRTARISSLEAATLKEHTRFGHL